MGGDGSSSTLLAGATHLYLNGREAPSNSAGCGFDSHQVLHPIHSPIRVMLWATGSAGLPSDPADKTVADGGRRVGLFTRSDRSTTRAITAASPRITGKLPSPIPKPPVGGEKGVIAREWQRQAWAFYDTAGPLKFVGMYRGNMFRRVRVYTAVIPEDGGAAIACEDILDPEKSDVKAPADVPLDLIEQAIAELARINPIAPILYDLGVNHTVAGDAWLVVEPDDYEGERWQVYSVTELISEGTWADKTPRWAAVGPPHRTLAQGTIAFRIYLPHPNRHNMADASTMGVLDDLEELKLISRGFRGVEKGRISSAGLLKVPDELEFPSSNEEEDDAPSQFAIDFLEHMTAPLDNEGSAANVAPMIVTGAGEHLKNLEHMVFERPGDAILDARETKTLGRFAIGMDSPPEIILGIGDVNHWNGAVVSEEAWKAHGEPGMMVITGQLGSVVLRTFLSSAPSSDGVTGRWAKPLIGRIVVLADASDVVNQSDQTQDAAKAHDAFVISDAAYRKYANFDEEDAPTEDEIAKRVEVQRLIHARGSEPGPIPPGDVGGPGAPTPAPALPAPAPAAPAAQPAPQTAPAAKVASAVVAAASSRPVGHRLADLDLALYSRIHGMAQAAVRRQLEKAGARITSKAQRNKPILEQAKTAPKHAVAASLGRTVVAALALTDDELVGDYTDLLDQVDSQVTKTRAAGLAALIAFLSAHGGAPSSAQLTEYEMQAQQDQQNGRTRLAQALAAFTLHELYEPSVTDSDEGEGGVAGDVPPGLVKGALAVYGGQAIGLDGHPDDGGPVRGVAGGDLNFTIGAQLGIVTTVYQWIHGDPKVPFPPHLALDGVILGEDPEADAVTLANTSDAWLGTTTYAPGDHEFCTCWVIPLLSLPGDS